MPKKIFSKAIFAGALALAAWPLPGFAADYFAVLPVQGPDPLQATRPVTLALSPLPAQVLFTGDPYTLNLGTLLSLDGPTGTTAANVIWDIAAGTLPSGVALAGNVISGTPTVETQPANVTIRATYPSASGPVRTNSTYQFEAQVGHGEHLYVANSTFVAPKTGNYEVYVVGGGGYGGTGNYGFSEWIGGPYPTYRDAAGGDGGYASTPHYAVQLLTKGQAYTVAVGPGGVASSFNGLAAGPGAAGASPSGNSPCCGYGTRSGYQRIAGQPGGAGANSALPSVGVSTRAANGAATGNSGGLGGQGCGAGGGGGSGGPSSHSDIWYGSPGGYGGAGAPGCVYIKW